MEVEEDADSSLHQQPPWEQWLEEAERRLAHVPTVSSYGRRMAVCLDIKEALFLWCPIPGCPAMLSALKHQLGFPATEAAMHPCTQLEQLMFLKQFIMVTPGTLLVDMAALKNRQDLFLLYKQLKARHENAKHPCVKLCKETNGKLAPLYYTKSVSKDLTKKKYLPAVVRTELGKAMSKEEETWSVLSKDGKMKFKRGKAKEETSNQSNLEVGQKSEEEEKQWQLGGPVIESVIYSVQDAVSHGALVPLALLREALPPGHGQAFLEDVARLYLLGRCAGVGLASVTTCLTAEALQLTRFLAYHKGYDKPWCCLTSCSLLMSWAEFHSGYARLRPNSVKLLPMTSDVSVITLSCEDIKKVVPELKTVSNTFQPIKHCSSTTMAKAQQGPTKQSIQSTLQKIVVSAPKETPVSTENSTQNNASSKEDKNQRNKTEEQKKETLNRDVTKPTGKLAVKVQNKAAQHCKSKKTGIHSSNTKDIDDCKHDTEKMGSNKAENNKTATKPWDIGSDSKVGTKEMIEVKKSKSRCSVRITRSNTNASKSNENLKSHAVKPKKKVTKDDANNSAIEEDEEKKAAKQAPKNAKTGVIKPKPNNCTKVKAGGSKKQETNKLTKKKLNESEKDKNKNIPKLSPHSIAESTMSKEKAGTLQQINASTYESDQNDMFAPVVSVYAMRKGMLLPSDLRPSPAEQNNLITLRRRVKHTDQTRPVTEIIVQAASETEMTSNPDSSRDGNTPRYVSVIPKQLKLKTPPQAQQKPQVSPEKFPYKAVRNVNELAQINGTIPPKSQNTIMRTTAAMNIPHISDPITLAITINGAGNKPNMTTNPSDSVSLPGPLHPISSNPASGSTSVKLPDEIVTSLKEQASIRSPRGSLDTLRRELQGDGTIEEKKTPKKPVDEEDNKMSEFQTERITMWQEKVCTGDNCPQRTGRPCKSAEVTSKRKKGYVYRPNSSIYSHTEAGFENQSKPCFKTALCSVFSRGQSQRMGNEGKQKRYTGNCVIKASKQKTTNQPDSFPNYGSSSSMTPDIYDEFARKRRPKMSSKPVVSQGKVKPIAFVPKNVQVPPDQGFTGCIQHKADKLLQQATPNHHTAGYSTSQEAINQRATLEKMSQAAEPFQQKYVHTDSARLLNLHFATMMQTNCKPLDPPPTKCPSCVMCRHLADTLLESEIQPSFAELSQENSSSYLNPATSQSAVDESKSEQLATSASESFNNVYNQMRLLQKVNSFAENCISPQPSGSLESIETLKSLMSRDFTSDMSLSSNRGKDCIVEACKTNYYPFRHSKDCSYLSDEEDEMETYSGEQIARVNSQLYFTAPGYEGLFKVEGDITIPANAEFYVQRDKGEYLQAFSSYSGTSLAGSASNTFLNKLRRLREQSSNHLNNATETNKDSEHLINVEVLQESYTEVGKDVEDESTVKDSKLMVSESSQSTIQNKSEVDKGGAVKSSSTEGISPDEAEAKHGETTSDKQEPVKYISPTVSKTSCKPSQSIQTFQDFVEENRASKKKPEVHVDNRKKKFWASAQVKYLKDCQTTCESSNNQKVGKGDQKLASKPILKTLKEALIDAPNQAKEKSAPAKQKPKSSSTKVVVQRKPRPKTSPGKSKTKVQDVKQRPKTGRHRQNQKHKTIGKDKSMAKVTPIEKDMIETNIQNKDAYSQYRDPSCTSKTKTSQNEIGTSGTKPSRSAKSVKRARNVPSRYKVKNRQPCGDTCPVESALRRLSIEEDCGNTSRKNEARRHRLRSFVQAEFDKSPNRSQDFKSSSDDIRTQRYSDHLINPTDSQTEQQVKTELPSLNQQHLSGSQQDQPSCRKAFITQMNQNAIMDDQGTPVECSNQKDTPQPGNAYGLIDPVGCLNSNKNNVTHAEDEVDSLTQGRATDIHSEADGQTEWDCTKKFGAENSPSGVKNTSSINICQVPSSNFNATLQQQYQDSCHCPEQTVGCSEALVFLPNHCQEVEPAVEMFDTGDNGETMMMFQQVVDADGVEWLQLTGPDGSVYHIAKDNRSYASLTQFCEEQQNQYAPEYSQVVKSEPDKYWNEECYSEEFVIVNGEQNRNVEKVASDEVQCFGTIQNVAHPECDNDVDADSEKTSELLNEQESLYMNCKHESVNDQSEPSEIYYDPCDGNHERPDIFSNKIPDLGNFAEEVCTEACANGCDHIPSIEIDRAEVAVYAPGRYTDAVDDCKFENAYIFTDETDSVNEITVHPGNEHESNDQPVCYEVEIQNANAQAETENDFQPHETPSKIQNIKQEPIGSTSTTDSPNSCLNTETRLYDKSNHLHLKLNTAGEAKKSVSSDALREVFKDPLHKIRQNTPSATHNDKTNIVGRASNSDTGLVLNNRQKAVNSDRKDFPHEAGKPCVVESSSDLVSDSDLDYEADEDDDRDEDYVPEESDENNAVSDNEHIGDIGDIYDDVRIINKSLGKTENLRKPKTKMRKSLKSLKCKQLKMKSQEKSFRRKSLKKKQAVKSSKQLDLKTTATTEMVDHNKPCLDERRETVGPENNSDSSSVREEVDKDLHVNPHQNKQRKSTSKFNRRRKTLPRQLPDEKDDPGEEERAAESFIQKQKRYLDIIKNSSTPNKSASEPALDDSTREEKEEPLVEIVKEVPSGIPVHGERVISKAMADAEKALEGTGSLTDDYEPAVIQDQAHRCTYQLVEDEDHINLGGIAYFRHFSLPFVYINGYKYVPLRDTLTLFTPAHCVSNCTIPRSVLQKNRQIVKSFSTWDQVYKFELIKMKKGPAIMTGDTVIKLDSLLDALPSVVAEIVTLHHDTKLKRSQNCDVKSYNDFWTVS